VSKSQVHDVAELLDILHGLQQSTVDSAIDGEHVFAPAYGPKEDILSSDNMLIECSKFVECVFFFKSVNNSQSYHKSLAQLCHPEFAEQLQHV